MDLIGTVKDDIITLMQANLVTKLRELETRFADSVTLPDPATYWRNLVDPTAMDDPQFPALVLSAGRSVHKEDEDGVGEVGVPADQKWQHQVFISIVHRQRDGDSTMLTTILERYTLAVVEVLNTQPAYQQHLVGIDYGSPLLASNEGSSMWEVVVQLSTDTYEH